MTTPTPGALRAATRIQIATRYDRLCDGETKLIARIIDEETHAGELVHSLQFLTDAAETEPTMNIYRAHIEKARAAITAATKE